MLRLQLTRFLLIAALVFSQTLSAAHDGLHDNGGSAQCQVCLHGSISTALLPAMEFGAVFFPGGTLVPPVYFAPVISRTLSHSHLSRAPPTLHA